MMHRNRPIGYDVDLEDDALYPQPPRTTAIRYRSVETRDMPQQQRAVTRPRQQGVRKPTKYDSVNVYVRQRRSTHAPRPQQQAPRPPRQPEPAQDDDSETDTQPLQARRTQRLPRFGLHWLVYIGCGMLAALLLWMLGALALSWWHSYQDDQQYGHPRTYQCDARVGHTDAGTPSHFIALNLNHRAEVIELPGGDPTKMKVYLGPTLTGEHSDLDIVTVSFKDVNGDHKPDMLLSVDGVKYPYINDNGAFRPPTPNEHVNA